MFKENSDNSVYFIYDEILGQNHVSTTKTNNENTWKLEYTAKDQFQLILLIIQQFQMHVSSIFQFKKLV